MAEKLRLNICDIGCGFAKYLANMNRYNFFMTPTDSIEVIDTINDLKSNKATGPNEILHLIKLILAEPLSKLINLINHLKRPYILTILRYQKRFLYLKIKVIYLNAITIVQSLFVRISIKLLKN